MQPLNGKHIAITRPIDQAKKLSALVTEAGGTPVSFPLIGITPLKDYSQFEAVINQIETYDWAIFISSNAAACRGDGLVASDQVRELLLGRRATSTDVRVVREDLVPSARRAVRHQHDRRVRAWTIVGDDGCCGGAHVRRSKGGWIAVDR